MFELDITKKVMKFIQKLQMKHQKQIKNKLLELSNDPYPPDRIL
jgi:mRNA-degrading endonuclease RelE of RelBE toxin-antitoxin system